MLGAHNRRLTEARQLLKARERRSQGRFLLEGPTVLGEAVSSGVELDAVFATAEAFDRFPTLQQLDPTGTPIYLVEDRTLKSLSDVTTPPGVIAIGRTGLRDPSTLFEEDGRILVLADLNDAGNAGTLVRAADAFGISRVIFGDAGVEPYHPKVVRAATGSLFRARISVCEPRDVIELASERSWIIFGLCREGEPLGRVDFGSRSAIVVGHERHGLGRWQAACSRLLAIPMPGGAESLNAAVAGGIALYEASEPKN